MLYSIPTKTIVARDTSDWFMNVTQTYVGFLQIVVILSNIKTVYELIFLSFFMYLYT